MSVDLIARLKSHADDPQFGLVIRLALQMLTKSTQQSATLSKSESSSTGIANIWKTKKQMGRYRKDSIWGVDETIASLADHEFKVRLGCIETEFGFIAMWMADCECRLAGVLLGRYPALTTEREWAVEAVWKDQPYERNAE